MASTKPTESDGSYLTENYNYAGDGSVIPRQYVDGTWDNIDFNSHIADNSEETGYTNCDILDHFDQYTLPGC